MTYNIAVMLIDPVDHRILALLRENARMSTALMGRRLGISRTTVHSRIERLLARRIITGFTVRMGADQELGQIHAQVMIAAVQKALSRVESALRPVPAARKLYSVSGQHAFIAIVVTATVRAVVPLL